jgi:hypothetical protein
VIIALFILEAYPVFSPVQLVDDKNILSSDQRMKGVDNTKSLSLIYCIRCSRYLMRRARLNVLISGFRTDSSEHASERM